jgi:expansin (peptidoglycan-binding protein)
MRVQLPLLSKWLVAALLPLVVACAPTDYTEALLFFHEEQEGLITFYDADGTGNCLYDASPQDMDVAAMNIGQFLESAVCGSCVEIQGPKGTLRVRVVDSCPDCPLRGHLDLSEQAFVKLADRDLGRVNVRWRMVTCDNVVGPLRYRFKEGSNPHWAGIQVFNHRQPVTKLDYWKNGAWVPVARESYNYFVAPKGMGAGPIKVRVTALDGQTLEDTFPEPVSDNSRIFEGAAQFRAN